MIKYPKWLKALPEAERSAARQRFLVRLAALYATEQGDLAHLATAVGRSKPTITVYSTREPTLKPIPWDVAIAMEEIAGSDVMLRNDIRPDIFGPPVEVTSSDQ